MFPPVIATFSPYYVPSIYSTLLYGVAYCGVFVYDTCVYGPPFDKVLIYRTHLADGEQGVPGFAGFLEAPPSTALLAARWPYLIVLPRLCFAGRWLFSWRWECAAGRRKDGAFTGHAEAARRYGRPVSLDGLRGHEGSEAGGRLCLVKRLVDGRICWLHIQWAVPAPDGERER